MFRNIKTKCLWIVLIYIFRIRCLISGYSNVKQFREELNNMSIPISDEVEHMLCHFDLTGDVSFIQFAKAFDKVYYI